MATAAGLGSPMLTRSKRKVLSFEAKQECRKAVMETAWTLWLQRLWGLADEEKGGRISGHVLVSMPERTAALMSGADPLFGEILSGGVRLAMSAEFLNVASAKVVLELGHGLGKTAIQCFLENPGLELVHGVEFMESRFIVSREAARRLCKKSMRFILSENRDDTCRVSDCIVTTKKRKALSQSAGNGGAGDDDPSATILSGRSLVLQRGSMFDCVDALRRADIVICDVCVPKTPEWSRRLIQMFLRVPVGCRIMTYDRLETAFEMQQEAPDSVFPFAPIGSEAGYIRLPTSWSATTGNSFYGYIRR